VIRDSVEHVGGGIQLLLQVSETKMDSGVRRNDGWRSRGQPELQHYIGP
jgi:hypothetical protein